MNEQLFLKWLDGFLSGRGRVPAPPEGLSGTEALFAEKIRDERKKAEELGRYAKASLATLRRVEQFGETAIRSLSALVKISELCEAVKNIDTLCKRMTEILSRELEFENCSIMLLSADRTHLRMAAGKGKGDRYALQGGREREMRIRIGEGIAGRVAESGEYLSVPNVAEDGRFVQFDMKVNVTSLLSVPLRSNGRMIGVINLSHPLPEAFDENKVGLVLLLANFIGHIITIAALHDKIAGWNKLLEKEVREKTDELSRKNRELHRIAVTDPLTGIYNRRFFFMRLEEEFSRSLRYDERMALLIIDLDNLKAINDLYGHIAGDKVIKKIAQFLKKSGRRGDVISRIGGDEFGYILLNATTEEAYNFASRIKERFKALRFKGVKTESTLSIGIASSPHGKLKRHQDIYRAADDALYSAKKKRDCIKIFQHPGMRTGF